MIPKQAKWSAVTALAVALACSSGVAPPADAQMPAGGPPHSRSNGMAGRMPGLHLEGLIAFLKAELAITDAQLPLWDKVVAAMREDVARMTPLMAQAWDGQGAPETAVAYLEQRANLAAVRADGEARFLAAFRPLYDALSPDQKKAADELLAHGWR